MSPAAMVPRTGFRAAGVLIPVVGPSGAGKDSIITAARRALAGRTGVVFARRVVTRGADPDIEDHDSIGAGDFDALESGGAFAASWRAHGLAYGVPASIADDIDSGCVVVVNVSRGAITGLRRRFARVHVVHVTATVDVLVRRLRLRGRESDAEITRRLVRADELAIPDPPVTVIDNSGALADAVEAFLDILADYLPVEMG